VVCVYSDFHRTGVFIVSWGSSTDLVEAVTHQVVADRPTHVASQSGGTTSTTFLYSLDIPLLM
jgi:hypothetical protein